MNNVIETRAQELNLKQRHRRLWIKILTVMACVVVFCTTYALILPAITAEGKTFCGKDAHEHTEECYENILICGQTASEHVHTGDCYETRRVLICTLQETDGHTHSSQCETVERVLSCELAESEGHTHTDACVELRCICGMEDDSTHIHEDACYEAVYVCGLPQSDGHHHTDGCYSEKTTITCGLPETEGHHHTDRCYGMQEVCVCEEGSTHVHTDACYETQLVCDMEEHTHDKSCYSDPEADVETAEDWEDTLPEELSGEYPEDALRIAVSQLNYEESTRNYVVLENGAVKGYSRFGAWYGDPYGDWCAMFVSFCLSYAEVEDFPLDSNCQSWIEQLQELEEAAQEQNPEEYHQYYLPAEDYIPEPGDVIFFNWDDTPEAEHVGLVYEYIPATEDTPERVKTIEGNSGDRVRFVTYDLEDERIMGYGRLPEQLFYCGKIGHVHDLCEKSCENEEHIHTDACREDPLTAEERARVDAVEALIAALPDGEAIEEMLAALEADGDTEGYDASFEALRQQGLSAYAMYEDLGETLQAYVPSGEKLLGLSWLWSAQTMEITDTQTVYQVNKYEEAATTLVHGGSVRDKLGTGMSFAYWDALIVEKDAQGQLYVSKVITKGGSKLDCKATSAGGFVLLFYKTTANAKAGDYVTVSFDYSNTTGYNAKGYGTVSFDDLAGKKPDKDNSSALTTVPGASTRELIEVNLYDYGTNINDKYNGDKNYPGFQQDGGTKNQLYKLHAGAFNFGNNITEDLAAGHSDVTNKGGDINKTENAANSPISGAMAGELVDGYPAVNNGLSLKYLFSDNEYAKKQNTISIDGLFRYDEVTGEYSYNSRKNHAQFNSENDTFTLYRQVITSNYMMYPFGNFLPFNDIVHEAQQASQIDRSYLEQIKNSAGWKYSSGKESEYETLSQRLGEFISLMDQSKENTSWTAADCVNGYFSEAELNHSFTNEELENIYSIDYDEATDFYFGMEMKMEFIQPKDGMTGKDTNKDGKADYPMLFKFSGDDDVWVYIDGKLFLDLSGIHRHVGGEINFTEGKICYYDLDVTTGDVSTTPSRTVTFEELLGSKEGLNEKGAFADFTTHTFNFYYMERGAGSGVCRMNFNFPLMRQNSVTVTKTLSLDEGNSSLLGKPDFRFQALREDGETLFIDANVSYDILDASGNKIGTGSTDENGIFTLKEDQTAVFQNIPENAGNYFIRELLDDDDFRQYGTVLVDGSAQTESYDVTIDSDTFKGISSPLKNVADGNTIFQFNNRVTTKNLSSLTIRKQVDSYSPARGVERFQMEVTLDGEKLPVGTVYTVDGIPQVVETQGIISLGAGETATISGILAGTEFTVVEKEASGYQVSYSVDGKADTNSGIIHVGSSVAVLVNNEEIGATVEIPVTKTLINPETGTYTYHFKLCQVDEQGEVLTDGLTQETDVTLSADKKSDQAVFTLDYVQTQLEELPASFFYQVTEVAGEDDGVRYDTSVYLVKVDVDEVMETTVTIQKSGETVEEITFENTLLGSLSLSKKVSGTTTDQTFAFTVDLGEETESCFVTRSGTTTEETLENGQLAVALKDGETVTITGIPVGTSWSITETQSGGYTTGFQINDGETTRGSQVTGEITSGETAVRCINTPGYALPETGGTGTWAIYLMGVLLVLASGILLKKRA